MGLYNLTDEQKLIQQNAREFAENVVVNYVDEMERTNRLPKELVKKAGEMGFYGLLAPEEYGGSNMGLVTGMLVCEEIAKVSPAFACSLYVSMIITWESEGMIPKEILDNYVTPSFAGDKVLATLLVDPAGAINDGDWPVFAVREGDEYVLNGTRLYATNTATADCAMVKGYTDDGVARTFWVPLDLPGIEHSQVERKVGLNGQESGTTVFKDVRIPVSYEAIAPNPELRALRLYQGFYLVIACSTGGALAVVEKTRQFLLNRKVGDGCLYDNLLLSGTLAHRWNQLILARTAMYDAAEAIDNFNHDPDPIRTVYAAKDVICPLCLDIAVECMQLHGGLGVCEDAGISRYVRDMMPLMDADLPKSGHQFFIATMSRDMPYC